MKKTSFGLFWIGSAAFASLGACHSSASSPDVSQVNSFIQGQAQAACDWEFNCCKDAEIKALDANKYTTKEQCLAYQQLSQEDSLYLARLAVSEGRMRVDSTHAAACLQQMSKKACNPLPGATLPPPAPTPAADDCALALAGTTPVGAECIYAMECITGAHCVNDAQAVGRGVCVPYQKVGDICNGDTDCDPATPQIYCAKQDFKCHVRGKIGEACAYTTSATGGTGSAGASLPMLLECDQSVTNAAYCDPASSTCKTLPGAGLPCLSPLPPGVSDQCNPDPTLNLTCTGAVGTGGGAGTCRAPGKVGEDCSTLPCSVGLYCNNSGTTSVCAPLPGLGQPCPLQQCAAPYYCAFSPTAGVGTCSQPAGLGQDCSTVSCDTGLYCDNSGTSRVCAALLPDGSSCLSSMQCRSLACGGSPRVCQPNAVGAVCTGR